MLNTENIKYNPITVGAPDGQCVSVQGGTYRILVTGGQTNRAFATIDMLIPPGSGPDPHAHADIQESFFVVDGEVAFKSEAGTYTATKGSYVVIPKGGIAHCFKNKTHKTARLLCTVVPAGLEEFFLEVGQPVAPDGFLPRPHMDSESLKKLQVIGEQYGQKIFPPDYLDNID